MKAIKVLVVFFLAICSMACGDDSDCVLCESGSDQLEVCQWDESTISVGPPGSAVVNLFENTTIGAEVALLEGDGWVCDN